MVSALKHDHSWITDTEAAWISPGESLALDGNLGMPPLLNPAKSLALDSNIGMPPLLNPAKSLALDSNIGMPPLLNSAKSLALGGNVGMPPLLNSIKSLALDSNGDESSLRVGSIELHADSEESLGKEKMLEMGMSLPGK